jgi:hypothetical protein
MMKKLTTLACLLALACSAVVTTTGSAQTAAERRREREQRRDERRDSLRDTFTGWDRLAERTISPTGNSGTLNVATSEHRYDRLRLQVQTSSVVVRDVVVTMADGSTFRADATFTFSSSNTTHEIDLPGDAANVTRIDFNYSDIPAGQTAQVEVWGR